MPRPLGTMPRIPQRERLLFLLLLALFLVAAARENLPEIPPWNYHFGGEYGNIAASLVRGEGYANPFNIEGTRVISGPTAWMPPVYTLLIAALFQLFGEYTAGAVWAVLALKYLSLSVVGVLLFRICVDTTSGNWAYLVMPIYLFLLRASFQTFFQFTHDVWIVMLVLTLLVYLYHRALLTGRPLNVGWFVLGGVAALVNPVLGAVFLVLTLLPWAGPRPARKAMLLLVTALCAAPWIVRNFVVFDQFIPVKANLFYDLYQGAYLDDDGILTKATFEEFHPHNNEALAREYASAGEKEFLAGYRRAFLERLAEEPGTYLSKVANRALGFFLVYPVFDGAWEVADLRGRVKAVLYALPAVFCAVLLLAERGGRARTIGVLAVVLVAFALPYVAVGFYRRYRDPLTPVAALLIFYFVLLLAQRLPRMRLPEVPPGLKNWWRREIDLRSRRTRALYLIGILAVVPLTACGRADTSERNVLVVLIDCLRADHVSGYGYPRETTPSLDALAAEAVTFRQAISQSSFTKTSIASLFTGRNAYRHGVYSGSRSDEEGKILSDVLAQGETTLAEVLAASGYATLGLLQQGHLRDYMGFAQGFETYDANAGGVKQINDRFLTWLDGAPQDRSWFAYLHYIDLHDPYKPGEPYNTMFGEYRPDVYAGFDLENWGQELAKIRRGERVVEASEVEQLKALYDGLLRYIDDQLGMLLEQLEEEGVLENTLVVVTSDHGDGFMEHGFLAHSTMPYEELVRVPLVVRFPGGDFAGREISRQVRLIDLMPTVLEWVGLELPSRLDGVSLLPLLRAGADELSVRFPRFAISETAYSIGQSYPWVTIRTQTLKYHHRREPSADELYDLGADPGETNNLAPDRQGELADFRRMALAIVHKGWSREREEAVVDEETVKELRALGYIE